MNPETRTKIIELFNLGSLAEDKQNEMVDKLSELVFEGAMTRAAAAMNEEEQQQLGLELNENTPPEQIMGILNKHIPNFSELVAEELNNLKERADMINETE